MRSDVWWLLHQPVSASGLMCDKSASLWLHDMTCHIWQSHLQWDTNVMHCTYISPLARTGQKSMVGELSHFDKWCFFMPPHSICFIWQFPHLDMYIMMQGSIFVLLRVWGLTQTLTIMALRVWGLAKMFFCKDIIFVSFINQFADIKTVVTDA